MAVQRTFICLAATALLMQLAMAADYTVGGSNGGWDLTTDMKTWSASQSFFMGDTLSFQYTATHDVLEVSKADYDSCQTSNAVQSYGGGNTVITLSSPGKRYFICGKMGHCSGGMKLEVDTLATSSSPPASPSTPPPSSPTIPPPQPLTPSTPPPSSATTPPPQASPSTPKPAASPSTPKPAASPSTPSSASPVSHPVSSSAPEISSPSPAQSPKTAPTVSPTSPSSSPSSSPPPTTNVPSTESPITAPPPGSSSATKGVSETTVAMGFSLGMLMLLLVL